MIKDYSIVCTVFNDEKEIAGLLDNLLEQTILPKEVIVVDGGSKDRTVEILKGLETGLSPHSGQT